MKALMQVGFVEVYRLHVIERHTEICCRHLRQLERAVKHLFARHLQLTQVFPQHFLVLFIIFLFIDKTRHETFVIIILPVQFLGTQLAKNASRGVPN